MCKYIQDDMIIDFITYVNKNDMNVATKIEDSFFLKQFLFNQEEENNLD